MDVAFDIVSFNATVFMDVPFILQVDCIILHLRVVEENIEIQKKQTYELNKHFWDNKTTLGKICSWF